MMDSFDYFRHARMIKTPRTPASALHGVEDGILPPETYIYRATSIKPLFEAPVELEEIDRILAYPWIDIETVLLITNILNNLIINPDKEIALFAAESMGAIERRYTQRIEGLKKKFRKTRNPMICRYLARLYFNLARLNGREEAIQKFYLRESYTWLRKIKRFRKSTKKEIILTLRVLLELRLYTQAEAVFKRLKEKQKDPDIQYLWAATEFYKKNYPGVIERCSLMRKTRYGEYYRFWSGKSVPNGSDI